MRELASCLQARQQRLAFQQLQSQKVDVADLRPRRMNLVCPADIGMTHRERALQLRRQKALKPGFGGFDRNPNAALAVKSLIDDAHAPFADLTDDLETLCDQLSRRKGAGEFPQDDHRVLQKAAHARFRANHVGNFPVELSMQRQLERVGRFGIGQAEKEFQFHDGPVGRRVDLRASGPGLERLHWNRARAVHLRSAYRHAYAPCACGIARSHTGLERVHRNRTGLGSFRSAAGGVAHAEQCCIATCRSLEREDRHRAWNRRRISGCVVEGRASRPLSRCRRCIEAKRTNTMNWHDARGKM